IEGPDRIVSTGKFDEAWYPGEAVRTLVLVEQGGRTTLTNTMRYESRAARDAVLKSGMESGVKASYDRLAGLLASTPARGRACTTRVCLRCRAAAGVVSVPSLRDSFRSSPCRLAPTRCCMSSRFIRPGVSLWPARCS